MNAAEQRTAIEAVAYLSQLIMQEKPEDGFALGFYAALAITLLQPEWARAMALIGQSVGGDQEFADDVVRKFPMALH